MSNVTGSKTIHLANQPYQLGDRVNIADLCDWLEKNGLRVVVPNPFRRVWPPALVVEEEENHESRA